MIWIVQKSLNNRLSTSVKMSYKCLFVAITELILVLSVVFNKSVFRKKV